MQPNTSSELGYFSVFFILFTGLMLITQLSFSCGMYVRKRWPRTREASPDFIPSTILGLVALLLGFTFSMVISRYDHRFELVVKEANAIGTTFLRAKLMDPHHGTEAQALLKQYVDARLEFADAKAAQLQDQLWNLTIQMTKSDRQAVTAQFISSMNEVIDLQAERSAALYNVMPKIVYWIILFLTCAGLGSLAFTWGEHSPSGRWKLSLLVFLFVSVFTLIRDLDHPLSGSITLNQKPLRELQRVLAR